MTALSLIDDLTTRAAVGATTTLVSARQRAEVATSFRWVWIVLIGILIVAAAVAWVYCRNAGYAGFTGNMEAVRGPLGVKIGIKLGCY